ncbi:MAG TPA: PAS domain-containing sensor histidine kinase [Gammaproteobacteria bacterium]|jgi:signal transduction histidine kinase|nr:PAS domain-containing sensor histidine kinase [Gammaproteobacteria bacterium]
MIDIEKEEDTTKTIQILKDKITQLEDIIGLLPGHVYWLDRNHVIQGCNEAQAHFARLPSKRSMIGKTNHELIWKSFAPEIERINTEIMEQGFPRITEESVTLDDQEKIYLSHKVPLCNAKNEVVGLLGVSLDITERKRMEKELKLAKQAAEVANEAKTEFIRNMEHDIRTPLCGIMNVVTYLQTIEEDSKKKEFLSDIHIATSELLNYLENIFEFSQIMMGTVPLIFREFDLQQLIQGICNLESAAVKDRQIELKLHYVDNIPKLVIGDRFRVHRVLLNLISNAIKFTAKGSVEIHVNAIKDEVNNQLLFEIKISDTGIGIADKYHDIIFEKFTRCDPSNRGVYKGKGLGLWIVKSFIEDLKGSISLQSELGKGSSFTCLLPFKMHQ